MSLQTNESAENYLESVLILKREMGSVRSIDIAHHLGFTKPSISRAMSLLKEKGNVTIDVDGFIELTNSGLEIAERIYERHELITTWLISLGVSPETAASDACRMEHVMSEETFSKIKHNAINVRTE